MPRIVNYNNNILEAAVQSASQPLLVNFPKVQEWIKGSAHPTINQLAQFAKAVNIPFGFFFLKELPEIKADIPLFRTQTKNRDFDYSHELKESIRLIQNRQAWLREYLISEGAEKLPFVNSVSIKNTAKQIAEDIRVKLKIPKNWSNQLPNKDIALKFLIERTEQSGIFVAMNGVVANNTHRPLSLEEFRGFVLCDEYAPYIFINGKDFLGGKIFTLAHELVHIWMGKSGAFDLEMLQPADNVIEKLCDDAAAELLVPAENIIKEWELIKTKSNPIQILERYFKVSQIVIARRLLDLKLITKEYFFKFYNNYKTTFETKEKGDGGNFYLTQNNRVGKAFFEKVNQAALQGKLLYSDAYKLTGLYGKTFQNYEMEL